MLLKIKPPKPCFNKPKCPQALDIDITYILLLTIFIFIILKFNYKSIPYLKNSTILRYIFD